MAQGNGVAFIPIFLESDSERVKFVYLDSPQNKGNKKLMKVTGDMFADEFSLFSNVVDMVPSDDMVVHAEFTDKFTYDRPTSTGRGFTRISTDVHVYMVGCSKEWISISGGDDCMIGSDPSILSFESEQQAVEDAVATVSNDSHSLKTALTELSDAGSISDHPSQRKWVTVPEIKTYDSPFKYGYEIEFAASSGEPWHKTEADYTPAISEHSVERAVERANAGGFRFGTYIYCCNPHCTAGETFDSSVEMFERLLDDSPHHPSPAQREKLSSVTEEGYISVPRLYVADGDTLYLLVAPLDPMTEENQRDPAISEDNSAEIVGWYCSAECVDAVPWPSSDCLAVAAEVYVGHPHDVRRSSGEVYIDSILGVYSNSTGKVQPTQKNLTDF